MIYNLSVADHHVGSSVSDSDTEAVTILLTGANDVPTLVPTSILSGAVAELANTTASAGTDSVSGSIGFVDVDLNDRPTPGAIDPSLQAVTWTDATHDYTSELTPPRSHSSKRPSRSPRRQAIPIPVMSTGLIKSSTRISTFFPSARKSRLPRPSPSLTTMVGQSLRMSW